MANKHFFERLLPGFESHLKIPAKFFSDHIEGKHEGETVSLRSDASETKWKVKMEGQRFTQGWKEFVKAHDLRIGDIVVFRHRGDMKFHVTALGPGGCEITPGDRLKVEDEEERVDRSEEEEDDENENLTAKSNHSSPDLNLSVTASNISANRVTVPIAFAKQNGLDKGSQEILLMNEQGESWESEVKSMNSGQLFIVRGWKSFCTANNLEVGESCPFTLLQIATKPVFRLSRPTKEGQNEKSRSPEENEPDKTRETRFVKLTPSVNSLAVGKQHLPVSFTRVNGLDKPTKTILVDKKGTEWSMKLNVDKRGAMYIGSCTWKSFCAANEVGPGESLTLELIPGGANPLFKFFSKVEQSPSEAEAPAHKRSRFQKRSGETKTPAEGESSRRTRASNKSSADQGNLEHTEPGSVSDQVSTVKKSVVDTLTSIRRFQTELKTMEKKLEDSLPGIGNLERRV
ncbi:unnamed protein product [Microthlaspi erraticum]|uniref:TF-B3 domain-containing protein n=1 Tax=Microthlaspi erraticum TaxID=1685480 RepID=A0A6D2HG68_9BRAS|nr:unnamed protein product [Microthlaspi erraticum]CAA7033356.1 unnamed protein product [Microthlaspi erraticum]